MYKIVYFILFIMFSMMITTELQAPEISSRDIFGFGIFRVAEDGSILDEEGVVKGWICRNTVYDAQLNIRH